MSAFLGWVGWDWGTLFAAALGLVAAAEFVRRYWHEAGKDAWRNPFGRFMLTRKALLVALFGLIIVNRGVGGVEQADAWPAQDFVTFLVFGAFAAQTLTPYRLLVNAQKAHTEKEATPHE